MTNYSKTGMFVEDPPGSGMYKELDEFHPKIDEEYAEYAAAIEMDSLTEEERREALEGTFYDVKRPAIAVITDSYRSYRMFLNKYGIRMSEAIYLDREDKLHGLRGVKVVRTGKWWESPVANSPMLELIERE